MLMEPRQAGNSPDLPNNDNRACRADESDPDSLWEVPDLVAVLEGSEQHWKDQHELYLNDTPCTK